MKVPALFILVLSASLSAEAVEVKIIGRERAPLLVAETPIGAEPKTVGQLSDTVLMEAIYARAISEYQGNDGGVLSVNHMSNDLEVISDTEMKAYGWCYSLNGEVSDLLANQQTVVNESDRIVWFYAYAHYLAGRWVSMCVPVVDFSHHR